VGENGTRVVLHVTHDGVQPVQCIGRVAATKYNAIATGSERSKYVSHVAAP